MLKASMPLPTIIDPKAVKMVPVHIPVPIPQKIPEPYDLNLNPLETEDLHSDRASFVGAPEKPDFRERDLREETLGADLYWDTIMFTTLRIACVFMFIVGL